MKGQTCHNILWFYCILEYQTVPFLVFWPLILKIFLLLNITRLIEILYLFEKSVINRIQSYDKPYKSMQNDFTTLNLELLFNSTINCNL